MRIVTDGVLRSVASCKGGLEGEGSLSHQLQRRFEERVIIIIVALEGLCKIIKVAGTLGLHLSICIDTL